MDDLTNQYLWLAPLDSGNVQCFGISQEGIEKEGAIALACKDFFSYPNEAIAVATYLIHMYPINNLIYQVFNGNLEPDKKHGIIKSLIQSCITSAMIEHLQNINQ